jgi:hypothetical protein
LSVWTNTFRFSTCCTGLFTSPSQEWLKCFSWIAAAVPLSPSSRNPYHLDSGGIPDNTYD